MAPQKNYYDLFGCTIDSTEKEILRAYRKKALTCHPDKNPDNPKAAELFIELSEVLKILTDQEARAAYDKVLKAKEAAKLRTQAYDAKRKKFKDDLDQRENEAQLEREREEAAGEKLEEQIRRLREEGSKLLKEQQELIEKQIAEELKHKEENSPSPKLKVKWKVNKNDHTNGGYNDVILREIFQKYGKLTGLVVSTKKNGLAIIEFETYESANLAFEFEYGREDNRLIVTWLEGNVPTKSRSMASSSQTAQTIDNKFDNFESFVLSNMKRAEEKKRMAKDILEKDTNDP